MSTRLAPPDDIIRQAEAGEAEAQNTLGRWYYETADDPASARLWFSRASAQGLSKATHNLGVLAMRDGEYERAITFLQQSVGEGWLPSFVVLGHVLEEAGEEERTVALYEAAAIRGDVTSRDALGRRAFEREDYAAALHWTRIAAEAGDPSAQTRLGTLYHEGLGIDRDPEQAASWFLSAARQGHQGAQLMIGGLYHNGNGVPADRRAAAFWLSRSRLQGNYGASVYWPRVERELDDADRAWLADALRPHLPEAEDPS